MADDLAARKELMKGTLLAMQQHRIFDHLSSQDGGEGIGRPRSMGQAHGGTACP
jgi:hypothetical protein